ncbi:hypothetical protein [Burkholderia sola]|uniref:hypothetical protein n=1 Tax=Burkholderia sola TaxID=2843302 RepID=UPI00338D9336
MMPVRYIRLCAAAVVVALATIGSAHAAGCMKGAVVGAVGGCIVGHHIAKQHEQEQAAQRKAAAQRMLPAQ